MRGRSAVLFRPEMRRTPFCHPVAVSSEVNDCVFGHFITPACPGGIGGLQGCLCSFSKSFLTLVLAVGAGLMSPGVWFGGIVRVVVRIINSVFRRAWVASPFTVLLPFIHSVFDRKSSRAESYFALISVSLTGAKPMNERLS